MTLFLITENKTLLEYYKGMTEPFSVDVELTKGMALDELYIQSKIKEKDVIVIDLSGELTTIEAKSRNKIYMLLKGPLDELDMSKKNEKILRSFPGTPEEIMEMIGEI